MPVANIHKFLQAITNVVADVLVKIANIVSTVAEKAPQQISQPLHLGITEAGGLHAGSVKSAIG